LTFGFRALESYRAAVVKVGHLTIPFPIHKIKKPFSEKVESRRTFKRWNPCWWHILKEFEEGRLEGAEGKFSMSH